IKPSVLAGRKDGLFRPRERRIAKGPDSDPNHLRHAFRLPKHRRSAMWTEVKGHGRSHNRASCERLRSTSNDVDRISRVKSRDPEYASGSPLAVDAMTHRDTPRFSIATEP